MWIFTCQQHFRIFGNTAVWQSNWMKCNIFTLWSPNLWINKMRKYHYHRQNNKGIVRVYPLRNTTICFHIKIDHNLSSMRFNYCIMILYSSIFPHRESNCQCLSKMVTCIFFHRYRLFKMIMRWNLRAMEAY